MTALAIGNPDDVLSKLTVTHYLCCRDKDVALCGARIVDGEVDDDIEPECVVCVSLNENKGFCPIRKECSPPSLLSRLLP